jgi:polysaccharide export outer membrane protein
MACALSLLLTGAAPSLADDTYRVGPGDVLEVRIAGHHDQARIAIVQTTGAIKVPGAPGVEAAGMTLGEIGRTLTRLLQGHPAVSVTVQEYRSRSVWVRGEVQKPGRRAYTDGLRLVDLLLKAGGFAPSASGDVRVERGRGTFRDGSTVLHVRLERTGPTPEAEAALQTILHADDVVTVSPRAYVTVTGAVVRPGRYALDSEVTVRTAVFSAGGVREDGTRRVAVRRHDPASGALQTLSADLEAIERGREPDLVLVPGDQVDVPVRDRS